MPCKEREKTIFPKTDLELKRILFFAKKKKSIKTILFHVEVNSMGVQQLDDRFENEKQLQRP